jgi:hypothetical protein
LINADTHLIGFNPLALPSPHTAISVVADTALEAIERVWGDEDTRDKPTNRRALKGTLYANRAPPYDVGRVAVL